MIKKPQTHKELILQKLVEELLKNHPCTSSIKTLTADLGLPYYEDMILQMNAVLEALHERKKSSKASLPGLEKS